MNNKWYVLAVHLFLIYRVTLNKYLLTCYFSTNVTIYFHI